MKPLTKEDYFKMLDEQLSEDDRRAIAEMEDVIGLHFSLGLWIRNTWIHGKSEEEVNALARLFDENYSEGYYPFEPDDLSSLILEEYQQYLRSK